MVKLITRNVNKHEFGERIFLCCKSSLNFLFYHFCVVYRHVQVFSTRYAVPIENKSYFVIKTQCVLTHLS